MKQITPLLMFDGKAEEAMNFYVSLFEDTKIIDIKRYSKDEAGKESSVTYAIFSLNGQEFMCIDSVVKHKFTFTPSISIYVTCNNDNEITTLFEQLSNNGQVFMPLNKYPFSEKFGWLADKYGVSWQLNLKTE